MSYVGHGGLDRMATEVLVTSADVPALAQLQSAPVVLGWTCNLLRFDIPGFFSLGEQLLTEGASAGLFSATGWSNHFETESLRTAFTEAVFASDAETIGEAMLRAHHAAVDASLPMHRVYLLLGDPALRLRAPRAEPAPSPEPDPEVEPPPVPGSEDAPRSAADPAPRGAGCAVAASGAGANPFALGLWVLAALVATRRRRARRSR